MHTHNTGSRPYALYKMPPSTGPVKGINLFLSAMIIVALPYLITETFGFETAQANSQRLCAHGYGQHNGNDLSG